MPLSGYMRLMYSCHLFITLDMYPVSPQRSQRAVMNLACDSTLRIGLGSDVALIPARYGRDKLQKFMIGVNTTFEGRETCCVYPRCALRVAI